MGIFNIKNTKFILQKIHNSDILPNECFYKKRSGVTLIEVVIVIALMSVVSAIAYGFGESLNYHTLKNFAIELCDDLRFAAQISIIDGIPTEVYFENSSYTLRNITDDEYQHYVFKTVDYADIRLTRNGLNTIRYTPSGTLERGAQTVNITYKNKTLVLTVIPASGRVAVYSDYANKVRIY